MSIYHVLHKHASRLTQHPECRPFSFCTTGSRSSVTAWASSRDNNDGTTGEKRQETHTGPEADVEITNPLNTRWSPSSLRDQDSVWRNAGSTTYVASKRDSPISPLRSYFESNPFGEGLSPKIDGKRKETSSFSTVIASRHGTKPHSDRNDRQTRKHTGQTGHGTTGHTGADRSNPVNRAEFVKMMRLMPHGLVVVFAGHQDRIPEAVPWHGEEGMLISSFTSVTVNPRPYVSFNVKLPSSTYDKITKTGTFTVVAVNNAKIADAFTKYTPDRKAIHEKLMNQRTDENLDTQGVIWWMRCKVEIEKIIPVGDHIIVVGEVIDQGTCDGLDRERALVYFDGNYRLLGEKVKAHDDARMIPNLLPAFEQDIE